MLSPYRKIIICFPLLQMQLMPLGLDNVLLPSEEAQERMREAAQRKPTAEAGRRKWRRGEMEFEALMRHLDNAVSI